MADEKNGVFISHITEESGTALLLKDYLQRVFSKDLQVFVSSDYESIRGGDTWFTKIVSGVKSCAVVIVILSPDSVERRWINFEAGVGVGSETAVIPVVAHGLERGQVGQPLASLHIRSLQSLADIHAVAADVAAKTGRLQYAMIDASVLMKNASQPTVGSGWVGVEWDGSFLAIAGPIFKLKKVDDETFVKAYSDALRIGGFRLHMANRNHLAPSVNAGHKKVYLTDRKTYYAEITDGDTILMARRE